jgi:DNA-binding CsgD family transcriptional regulator
VDHLHADRLERALDVARELTELRELVEFPARSAELVRDLIPCDHSGYNAIDVASGRATIVAHPSDAVFDGGPELLAQLGDQSPLIRRARAGNMDAMRMSDHITQSALHRTDLYNHVYRLAGLEYQLVLQLPPLRRSLGRPHEVIGMSLSRSCHDFEDADLRLLQLIGPILSNVLERLHHLAFTRALAGGDKSQSHLVLFVDASDTISWMTPAVEERLNLTVGAAVPDHLRAWLSGQRECPVHAGQSHSLTIAGHQMVAWLIRDAYPELDAIHLTRVDTVTDPLTLQSIGLTRRQAEVLSLAFDGHNSERIAQRLGTSRRTVEKHFEGVYDRLGVNTRSQAILAAMDLLPKW